MGFSEMKLFVVAVDLSARPDTPKKNGHGIETAGSVVRKQPPLQGEGQGHDQDHEQSHLCHEEEEDLLLGDTFHC